MRSYIIQSSIGLLKLTLNMAIMNYLVVILACSTVAFAAQDCISCSSADNPTTMAGWNWASPYYSNGQTSNIVFNSYCDMHPWLTGGIYRNCGSMCFRWHFNYTSDGKEYYHTVRGCSDQLLLPGYPSVEICPNATTTAGGPGQPGGGPPGTYNTCFCNGDLCNPATKTVAFGIVTMMLIALFASMYQ